MTTTYERLRSPAHHTFEIRNFSELVKSKLTRYVGNLFHVGGYDWRMVVYPNGDKGYEGNVSVGVMIDGGDGNAEKFVPGWHVDADVKVFLKNWKTGKYLVQEMTLGDKYCKYDQVVKEKIANKLVKLDTLLHESNGYIKHGLCTFGVEILVMESSFLDVEKLTMVRKPSNGCFTWEITQYHQQSKANSAIYSPPFTVEGTIWKIEIYLNGSHKARGNWLSMFLRLVDAERLPPRKQVYAEYKLRVVNRFGKANAEKTITHWFSSSEASRGSLELLRLGDLAQNDKGFVVEDKLTVEAEIICTSVST